MTEKYRQWLAGLQPGDEVVADRGRFWPYRVERVERLTRTQIVLRDGTRWRRDTGVMVGAAIYLREPTRELREKIEKAALEWLYRATDPEGLSLDQLRRIGTTVKEGERR